MPNSSQDTQDIIDLAKLKDVPIHFSTKSDLDKISKGISHQVFIQTFKDVCIYHHT